jgi:eukaryotic-like serine/threonine-protein kinase
VTRLSITPPEKNGFPDARGTPPAVSPDGRQIVFEAVSSEGMSQLWLRPLDSLTPQPLVGTENATLPFWSPDGKWIGFFSSNKLKKVSLSGSPPIALADAANPRGGTWNPDGVIVFAPSRYSLAAVSQSGGAPRILSPTDAKTARRFPRFLPDARHFLYLTGAAGGEYLIAIGSLDSSDSSGKDDRTLPGAVDSFAEYAQGQLLFVRGNTLLARPFDSKKLAFTGDAVPVAEQVEVDGPVTALARFSVSGNGVLVYRIALGNARLTWLDCTGKRLGTLGDAGIFLGAPRFSPDRKTVAVAEREVSGGNMDIWLYDVSRGLRTRFTFDPADDLAPVWSPDGRTIVFRSSRSGPGNLFRKQADGSGSQELLYADDAVKSPSSFSPDGKYLAFTGQDPETGNDIWILPDPLAKPGTSKPYPLVRTEFNERNAAFSPNGLWMAYDSDESGRDEVYVAPFPGPGGKRQVSTAGGRAPLWRPDGKELFYYAADNRLMAAEVDAKGGAFEVKKVDALFGPLIGNGLDVSADGQRFLAGVAPEGETGEPLTVVLNWTAGLKK